MHPYPSVASSVEIPKATDAFLGYPKMFSTLLFCKKWGRFYLARECRMDVCKAAQQVFDAFIHQSWQLCSVEVSGVWGAEASSPCLWEKHAAIAPPG